MAISLDRRDNTTALFKQDMAAGRVRKHPSASGGQGCATLRPTPTLAAQTRDLVWAIVLRAVGIGVHQRCYRPNSAPAPTSDAVSNASGHRGFPAGTLDTRQLWGRHPQGSGSSLDASRALDAAVARVVERGRSQVLVWSDDRTNCCDVGSLGRVTRRVARSGVLLGWRPRQAMLRRGTRKKHRGTGSLHEIASGCESYLLAAAPSHIRISFPGSRLPKRPEAIGGVPN